MKLKEKKHLLIGAILGLSLGLFPITEIFTGIFVPINDLIMYIPRRITDIFFDCWFCTSSIVFSFIVSGLLFSIIGIFTAMLIARIMRSRKEGLHNNMENNM